MLAHSVKVTVFCKEGEDTEAVRQGLLSLFPFNLEEQKLSVEQRAASGFNDKRIDVLEVNLTKETHTRKFLEMLVEKLGSPQLELLLRQMNSRLDNELDFFIRLDKEELMKNKAWMVTDSGKCYHIRISVAAFPKKRGAAEEVVKKILSA